MHWFLKFIFYTAVFAIADSLAERYLSDQWWFMCGWIAGAMAMSFGLAFDEALRAEERGKP